MCGRYDLIATVEELAARFGVPTRDLSVPLMTGRAKDTSFEWQPSYNIAPQQHNPVVVRDDSGHNGHSHLELMRWGLVPAWSNEAKVKFSTINARAETVATKPAFRKPLASKRCLVPATGYFEWVEGAQGVQVAPDCNRGPGEAAV
jgi:putative SOS response-associated peptidase YedK